MNIQTYLTEAESLPNRVGNINSENSLAHFVFREKANRIMFFIALSSTIIQFIIFKLLYPFPDFISDSFSYINTNIYQMQVNLWPMGYSKIILFIHQISHSDTFLVAIQYFLLEASLAYFFFSIAYLYRPAKRTKLTIFLFIFFNPLFLYLSNCVLSDAIFTALTIIFFVQFLWMLYRPTLSQVIIQGIIIGFAFTIRYTAIYYPFVALTGLLLSRHTTIIKVWGTLIGVALMVPFILYTKQKTKEITGTSEFSVFGGWQLANNALYMYNHITVDSTKLPSETVELDRMTRLFFKKYHPSTNDLAALPGTYFIKVPWAVLKPYMAIRYDFHDPVTLFKAWGQVSPVYQKYGQHLIAHHPFAFARYYLLLNTKNYFLPHLEKFGSYNRLSPIVESEAQEWFGYITPDVKAISMTFQGKIFYIYPILFMVMNIYFIGFMIWLLFRKRYKQLNSFLRSSLLFTSSFLVMNFAFSVFATPIVLRYEVVAMILLFTFLMLILELPNKLSSNPLAKKEM